MSLFSAVIRTPMYASFLLNFLACKTTNNGDPSKLRDNRAQVSNCEPLASDLKLIERSEKFHKTGPEIAVFDKGAISTSDLFFISLARGSKQSEYENSIEVWKADVTCAIRFLREAIPDEDIEVVASLRMIDKTLRDKGGFDAFRLDYVRQVVKEADAGSESAGAFTKIVIDNVLSRNQPSPPLPIQLFSALFLKAYTDNLFQPINRGLWDADSEKAKAIRRSPGFLSVVRLVSYGLRSAPREPKVVYRGFEHPKKQATNLEVGKLHVQKTFLSTTGDFKKTGRFGNAVFIVHSKTGLSMEGISVVNSGEEEILHDLGRVFHVFRLDENHPLGARIEMEEVVNFSESTCSANESWSEKLQSCLICIGDRVGAPPKRPSFDPVTTCDSAAR